MEEIKTVANTVYKPLKTAHIQDRWRKLILEEITSPIDYDTKNNI